jgi:hypothetical protein
VVNSAGEVVYKVLFTPSHEGERERAERLCIALVRDFGYDV